MDLLIQVMQILKINLKAKGEQFVLISQADAMDRGSK